MAFRAGLSSTKPMFWIVLLLSVVVISYIYHRTLVQKLNFQVLQSGIPVIYKFLSSTGATHNECEDKKLPPFQSLQTGISVSQENRISTAARHDDLEDEVENIFNAINSTIPNVFFHELNETSSGAKSTAAILNYKPKYCIGDTLILQVQMFNYVGDKKTYGGDFLRARIFSPNLGAGASGRIEDLNNGTYNVYFTLFWEGLVKISILLMHPSEGVSALWRARSHGHKHMKYIGKFLNQSKEVHTECGFKLNSQEQICDYNDRQSGEFYCIKLPGVPCEAFVSLSTVFEPDHFMTSMEQQLFKRSNVAVEIPKSVDHVEVVKCQNQSVYVEPKCKTGVPLQLPSGYVLNNLWHSLHCNLSSYERLTKASTCLAGKMIYMMGDSTINQWMTYFPRLLTSLKLFGGHNNVWYKTRFSVDMTNNIFFRYKKHGHPFLVPPFVDVRDYEDVVQQINNIGGDANTVIAITVGHHFRPLPLPVFIRRILNIREAIQNMLLRSPNTKIIIKTENTRELDVDLEHLGDAHGYIQYNLVKKIFSGLNIGMVDVWDMTVAYGTFVLHPDDNIVKNQINMFLSYLC